MTPRTPIQFKEIREEKKTLIMNVALEHFASEGYHNCTISRIARHAGISKGLMYNYYESKEALLEAIIHRSVLEVYTYFDINKDGYLSEEEFDFFVRRISKMLNEKQSFWQLFFQLLMQNEVREQFLKSYLGSLSLMQSATDIKDGLFISGIMRTLKEYFIRKKDRKEPDYDPYFELHMFLISLKGFALTSIYMDQRDEIYYEKTVDRIIELYK